MLGEAFVGLLVLPKPSVVVILLTAVLGLVLGSFTGEVLLEPALDFVVGVVAVCVVVNPRVTRVLIHSKLMFTASRIFQPPVPHASFVSNANNWELLIVQTGLFEQLESTDL